MTSTTTDNIAQATQMLIEQIGQSKVVSSGPAYQEALHIWNAAVAYRPQIVVLCENTGDVQLAVRAAAMCGVSLSVRGGGHDWAGRALRGELVVDLTRMRKVSIEGQVATVDGSVISTELAESASRHGLTAVTGIVGSVGVAGLALGGGYGHFTARFGLAADNILGAEVVLADGRVVQADESHEPDLFWALRGGGGNFGVVTSLRLQLHPVVDVSDGIIAFPWEQAGAVFKAYNSMLTRMPDELGLMPTFFAAPDGTLSIVLHHVWSGDRSEDQRMIEQVKEFGAPSMVQVDRKTSAQILKEAERRTMDGIYWIVRTVTMAKMEPGAVEAIKEAMEHRSSPLSWIAAHPFYGAGERVLPEATAFGIRTPHVMVGIYTAWQPGEEAPHRAWADKIEAALMPYALASSYPNYFGTDRPEQTMQAYGPNTERLLRVKNQYDPNTMFSAISLPVERMHNKRRQADPEQ